MKGFFHSARKTGAVRSAAQKAAQKKWQEAGAKSHQKGASKAELGSGSHGVWSRATEADMQNSRAHLGSGTIRHPQYKGILVGPVSNGWKNLKGKFRISSNVWDIGGSAGFKSAQDPLEKTYSSLKNAKKGADTLIAALEKSKRTTTARFTGMLKRGFSSIVQDYHGVKTEHVIKTLNNLIGQHEGYASREGVRPNQQTISRIKKFRDSMEAHGHKNNGRVNVLKLSDSDANNLHRYHNALGWIVSSNRS